MTEHVDLCPNEATVAAAECHLCIDARKPCWTTPKGNAFHLRSDCPALEKYRQHPKVRTTVLWAKGDGYRGCHVCVNEVCGACAGNRHDAVQSAVVEAAALRLRAAPRHHRHLTVRARTVLAVRDGLH